MFDFYVSFFMLTFSTILSLILGLNLYIKSRLFIVFLKNKHPKIFFGELGFVKGPFGSTMGDSVSYLKYIYGGAMGDNKEILDKKKSFRIAMLYWVLSLIVIIISFVYLSINYRGAVIR